MPKTPAFKLAILFAIMFVVGGFGLMFAFDMMLDTATVIPLTPIASVIPGGEGTTPGTGGDILRNVAVDTKPTPPASVIQPREAAGAIALEKWIYTYGPDMQWDANLMRDARDMAGQINAGNTATHECDWDSAKGESIITDPDRQARPYARALDVSGNTTGVGVAMSPWTTTAVQVGCP